MKITQEEKEAVDNVRYALQFPYDVTGNFWDDADTQRQWMVDELRRRAK